MHLRIRLKAILKRQIGKSGAKIISATIIILTLFVNLSCDNPNEPKTVIHPIEPSNLNRYPSFSPDGKFVVYEHTSALYNDTIYPTGLYIVEVASGEKRLLIKGEASLPEWSPNSNDIIFTSSGILYKINSNGQDLKILTENQSAFESSWRKDGKLITFWGWKEGEIKDSSYLWVINPDGSNMKPILFGFSAPDWSPDGEKIVCMGAYNGLTKQLLIYDVETKKVEPLLTSKKDIYDSPKWSVKNKIAFIQPVNDRMADIYTIDPDGKNKKKLVHEGTLCSWSKDGEQLVYCNSNFDLCIINADGSGQKIILKNMPVKN